MSAVEAGLEAGASYDEIVGTLIAVIPIVGVARVVSAAPNLGLALGYDVAEALELVDSSQFRAADPSVAPGYCLAIAIRRRSSGVIRWSASSAAASTSICTQRTLPGELAVLRAVVVAHRRGAVRADVGRLVGGEEHRHRPVDAALPTCSPSR